MKKFFRFAALAAVAAGAAMIGYAVAEGIRRGFALDLDGNWDPAIAAFAGAAVIAVGAFAYAYFGHPAAGISRRKAFADTFRRFAARTLGLTECAGVAGGTYGFVMALSLAHDGRPSAWAFGLAVCGFVAWWCASRMATWCRGEKVWEAPADSSDGRD